MVRLDGTGYRWIAGPGDVPEWLPSGEEIVYHRADPVSSEIYIVDLNGNERALLPVNGSVRRGFHPVPSPDGQWVYFIGDNGAEDIHTGQELWRVRVNGTGLERVLPSPGAWFRILSISPDGSRMLIKLEPDGLHVLEIESGALLGLNVAVGDARWSPDGRWIAYTGWQDSQVHVMRADGTGDRVVSQPSEWTFYEEGLTWSPDGLWLIARAVGGLHRIEISSGKTDPLPWSLNYGRPAWRPN